LIVKQLFDADFSRLFEQCFQEYFESLHRYAHTLVKDSQQAKDIVQTVFVKWWEKRQEVNTEGIRAYLYKAVYNQSLNAIRNQKNRKTSSVDFGTTAFDITDPDKASGTEQRELEMLVKETIDELPPQCRLIFIKSRFEEKKYAEIATELGLSIKTIEAQIGKALRIVKEKLSDRAGVAIAHLVIYLITSS